MRDEVVSIAESELGDPPVSIGQVDEDLLHETYVLECDGAEYVLQFSSDADEEREDSLRRGLNWYLALQNSEIPVPEVVTERVKTFDGRQYTLVEKLPGKTGERNISQERVFNAGRFLAKVHDSRRFENAGWIRFEDHGPSVHEFEEGGLKRRIQRKVVEDSKLLRDGGLETAGQAVEELFDQRGGDLPDDFQPVLCHDDYSPDNILFQDERLSGILDFDRARSSHHQRDLVKAANGFWMHDPCSEWDVRDALYEGYRDVRELDSSFERNEPIYRVETLVGTVVGLLTMGELSEYEKAFYSDRILGAVERVEVT